MKKILFLLAMLPMMVFTACSSDDEDNEVLQEYKSKIIGTWEKIGLVSSSIYGGDVLFDEDEIVEYKFETNGTAYVDGKKCTYEITEETGYSDPGNVGYVMDYTYYKLYISYDNSYEYEIYSMWFETNDRLELSRKESYSATYILSRK